MSTRVTAGTVLVAVTTYSYDGLGQVTEIRNEDDDADPLALFQYH